MEEVAKKIAANIANSLHYNEEQEAVVAYGMIAIIQIIVTVVLVTILGLILGVWLEALVITFSVSILRKYSGGTHAKTIGLCTTIGVIYSVGFACIAKYLVAPNVSIISMALFGIITYIFSYLTVYKLAPVDTPNKPITTEKKRKRMRKGSYVTLSCYLVISMFSLLMARQNIFFAGIFISLIFGILWQILTLTKLGAKLTNTINQII